MTEQSIAVAVSVVSVVISWLTYLLMQAKRDVSRMQAEMQNLKLGHVYKLAPGEEELLSDYLGTKGPRSATLSHLSPEIRAILVEPEPPKLHLAPQVLELVDRRLQAETKTQRLVSVMNHAFVFGFVVPLFGYFVWLTRQ